jgi:methionine-rich copper-binding protein CopC
MNLTAICRFRKAPLVVLAVVMAAASALAHTHPEQMTPAANSTVPSPANVTIHFSEALEPKFSMITLTDVTGHVVNKEPSAVTDAKTMTLPLPTLAPGIYTVNWVGVAADTHRSQGDYKFTVK